MDTSVVAIRAGNLFFPSWKVWADNHLGNRGRKIRWFGQNEWSILSLELSTQKSSYMRFCCITMSPRRPPSAFPLKRTGVWWVGLPNQGLDWTLPLEHSGQLHISKPQKSLLLMFNQEATVMQRGVGSQCEMDFQSVLVRLGNKTFDFGYQAWRFPGTERWNVQ